MLRSAAGRHLAVLLSLSLVACGGGADSSSDEVAAEALPPDPKTACLASSPAPVALAVRDFIGSADPVPERFLNAATTDSALPSAAETVVTRKGPTFYWLPDAASQQQMREKLEGDGPWINMLVVVREQTDRGDGTWRIRVGGKYIGGANHETESPEKTYTVSCVIESDSSWVVSDAVLSGGA